MAKWNSVGRSDFFLFRNRYYTDLGHWGPFGLALMLYSVKVNPFWVKTDKIPMKIRLGMTPPRVSSGFFIYNKKLGGWGLGGIKIKVDGRSRDRTETCIVVLPYQEPEGINSFNPGQPIPLQTLLVSTFVKTAPSPNQSFLDLRFYTHF